jgi:hypothetical protein
MAGPPTPAAPRASGGALVPIFSVSVTWDGTSVSSAGSPASAFVITKGQTATVDFLYTQGAGGAIGNATLSLAYLGIALTTSRSTTHITGGPPITGAAQINWTFGPLYDALEGVFALTASLLYPNGTTAWSQSFYVFAKAPYLLESGAVVVLLILTIAEIYWGLASIRDARRSRKPAVPPPPAPTAGGTPPSTPGPDASPAPPTPEGGASGATEPPAGGAPPGTGGSP